MNVHVCQMRACVCWDQSREHNVGTPPTVRLENSRASRRVQRKTVLVEETLYDVGLKNDLFVR
jgi:hypothetical protein